MQQQKVFQNGDKVRVISSSNNSQNEIGEIGIIKNIEPVFIRGEKTFQFRVHVKGRSNIANWHDTSEVELISSIQ